MAYAGSYRSVRPAAPGCAPPTRWTPEQDAYLRKRYGEEGVSASVVAKEMRARFGVARSRNAVIGRVHRLGCASTTRTPGKPKRVARPRPKLPASEELRRIKARRAEAPAAFARANAPPAAPDMRLLPFDKLEAFMCRFIVGDPKDEAHRYCAANTASGAPWCAFHHALVYQTPKAWERANARAMAQSGAAIG